MASYMLKKLFTRLFGRAAAQPGLTDPAGMPFADSADTEFDPILPDEEQTEALRQFMLAITAHLGVEESERLSEEVIRHFLDPGLSGHDPVPDADTAVSEGVFGEDGQSADKPLMIGIDHRAADEIAWQANTLLATHGVEETWHWHATEDETSAMHAFSDLAGWLASRNLALLHLDLGGDAYHAFFAKPDKVMFILRRANDAQLNVFTHEAFRQREQGA